MTESYLKVRKATNDTIHGQNVHRKYSVAEVKELVYPLENLLDSAVEEATRMRMEAGWSRNAFSGGRILHALGMETE